MDESMEDLAGQFDEAGDDTEGKIPLGRCDAKL